MFPSDLQRDIPRRATEDADWPPEKWGIDRTVEDEEDFYPEADLPKANIVRRGKASLDSYYQHVWDTDTSEDECQLLITLDAVPLNAFRPDPEAPPASGTRRRRAEAPPVEDDQSRQPATRARGRSRGRGKKRNVPPSAPSESVAPAKKKIKRTTARQPKRPEYDG